VRGVTAVFASVRIVTVTLPDPVAGFAVTQLGAVTSQLVFEVTALVVLTTPAAGFHAVVGTVNIKPGCVTVIVRVVTGRPTVLVNTTVTLRATAVGFGCAVNTTVPSALPATGATDSQLLAVQVPVTCQFVFEDTLIVWLPPAPGDGAQTVVGDTVNMTGAPA